MKSWPVAMAALASLAQRVQRPLRGRRRRPWRLKRIGSVIDLNLPPEVPSSWRSLSSSSLLRIGDCSLICRADSRRRLEQVVLAADGRLHRHDDLFADAVDRRIGHLGEELLEVVVEQLRPIREHGQGGVVAHRADRLVAVLGHRRHQDLQIFAGVAEGLLPRAARSRDPVSCDGGPSGRSSSDTMLSRSQSRIGLLAWRSAASARRRR